jgi:hypothetical protein
VGVNHLHAAAQHDLFASAAATTGGSSATSLDLTVDQIRERFGSLALRRGSSLPEARGAEEAEDMSEAAPSRARERARLRSASSDKPAGRPGTAPRR